MNANDEKEACTKAELIRRAARHLHPPRIPFILNTWPGVWKRHPRLLEVIRERGLDDRHHDYTTYYGYREPAEVGHGKRGYLTPFGARVETLDGSDIGQPVEHPLGDGYGPMLEGSWRPPPPPAPGGEALEELRARAEEMEEAGFPRFAGVYCIMHELVAVRGFENVMMDLCDRSEPFLRLLDAVTDYCLGTARLAAMAGPDMVGIGDDWGTQNALYCRPSAWRELFKPRYARVVAAATATDAVFYFHSDGHIVEIIPDMLQIGVDVINPQLSCHEWGPLREAFGGRGCIAADLDRQHILAAASPARIKEHIHEVTEFFAAPEGGFILHAELSPNMSWEQVMAVLDGYEQIKHRFRPDRSAGAPGGERREGG